MRGIKNFFATCTLSGAVAIGALWATSTTASAYVACNRWGDCWQTSQRYKTYPRELGVVIHSDGWREHHQTGRYHWRDKPNDDHGYYDHGTWKPFENH